MTYEADAAAVGRAADTALAAVQAQLTAAVQQHSADLQKIQDEATQLAAAGGTITQLQTTVQGLQTQLATVTAEYQADEAILHPAPPPPPPPPPPTTTLWGASGLDSGPSSYPGTVSLLSPAMMRSYNGGGVTGWSGSNGSKVPAGIVPFDSAKWSETLVAAGDPATMAQVKDWLANGPGWRCWHHEPEGDFALATYLQAYAQIVKLGVRLDRLFPTIMAFTLGKNGVFTKWGNPDQFYIAAAGGIGVDCYSNGNFDMTQFDEAAKYAESKGKPWIIAEAGIQTLSSWVAAGSKPFSDDTLIQWADTLVARVHSYPLPPLAVSLMNHGPQLVDATTHQRFAAHWASIR